tara:strand:- start:653 stop:1117 length:465 start_codon:yes stop_codon:yes gene_type:complete
MNSSNIDTIHTHLTKLINLQCQLEHFLKRDIESFKNNDFQALEKSNIEKEALNASIHTTLTFFETCPELLSFSGHFLEKLELFSESLQNPTDKATLNKLIEQEKEVLMRVYDKVQVNSRIIDSNLDFNKHLIHQLVNQGTENASNTYDQSAIIR